MHLGEFFRSIEHFEKALQRYDPERHRHDSCRYAQNPAVAMRCFAAWALWFLGKPNEALSTMNEAVTLARSSFEPNSIAPAYFFAAILHQLRREFQLAQECAEAAIAVAAEHGLVLYQALATTARGWALFNQGSKTKGIEQMRQGLAAHQATGAQVVFPHFLALLAEALGKTDQEEDGLRLLEEAFALADRNGETYYQAELCRIKGELILIQASGRSHSKTSTIDNSFVNAGHAKDVIHSNDGKASLDSSWQACADPRCRAAVQAEACFRQSIKIAQQQDAKSLELRAATSIARLYQSLNRQQEARGILAQIYDRFPERFETPDLREAKALLQELS
jgi:predicted ATPase